MSASYLPPQGYVYGHTSPDVPKFNSNYYAQAYPSYHNQYPMHNNDYLKFKEEDGNHMNGNMYKYSNVQSPVTNGMYPPLQIPPPGKLRN